MLRASAPCLPYCQALRMGSTDGRCRITTTHLRHFSSRHSFTFSITVDLPAPSTPLKVMISPPGRRNSAAVLRK